jgi:2-polyprenyl-3-methyl-5-hydroxy-6-metoxy-1,4-benzoquinol methylase
MNFKDLKINWNALGKTDPFWAILTRPDRRKKNGTLMSPSRDRCLDFGCGAGRLSQVLADYFDEAARGWNNLQYFVIRR